MTGTVARVVAAPGEAPSPLEVQIPAPTGNQVLVRIHAVGVRDMRLDRRLDLDVRYVQSTQNVRVVDAQSHCHRCVAGVLPLVL